jgi:alginate O-acetyltransferase complex protein AlgI
MIFADLRFLLLFLVTASAFLLVPTRLRMTVLAVGGLIFYLLYAGWFLIVAALLTVLTIVARGSRAAWMTGAVIVTLLAVVKAPTLMESSSSLVVPLGFSYLAFELIHVLIERQRGKLGTVGWDEMFAFAFFAPARAAGPIKRLPAFRSAVAEAQLSATNIYAGVLRILVGFFKKFALADLLALTVAEKSNIVSTPHAWTVLFAFALQLLLDFSAYTDIAIGLGRILGIRLPENFRWPYFSRNIREFWERWHITLSQWVRDYIFSPLARRLFRTPLRKFPLLIATISYLVTFGLVGAWHGLTGSFIVWGLYHGALLAAFNVIQQKLPRQVVQSRWYGSPISSVIGAGVTFFFVSIGLVWFLLPLREAGIMLQRLVGVHP